MYSHSMASTKKKRTTTKAAKPTAASAKAAPKALAKKQDQELAKPTAKTLVAKAITTNDLFRWNKWLAWIHAIQGIVVLVLSATRTFPVTTTYLSPNPLLEGKVSLVSATHHMFDINMAWLVAGFFFTSAIAHGVIASVYRKRYEADLETGINRLRWIEYSVSASLMMVAIGLLSGVYDLSTLIMLFMFVCVMNLLGFAMEVYNQGKSQPNWLVYGIGCVAGIVPWVVVTLYLIGANAFGSGNIPGFVYWIYASIFICFSSFAVNMYLQYKKKGKWADYLYGERMYMILSLVAKTVLAWQVFAGSLRP